MRLIKSFMNASRGVAHVWKTQPNFRIQILAAIIVIVAMFYFSVPPWQKVTLLLLVMVVLVLEIINTVFEHLVDLFEPRLHHYVRDIKDLMAAAVLFSALISVGVAIVIFWPLVIG